MIKMPPPHVLYIIIACLYAVLSSPMTICAPFDEGPHLSEGLYCIPILQNPGVFAATYGSISILFSILWILLLKRPMHHQKAMLYCIGILTIMAFSFPVGVHDFYLSVAWGRTIIAGINPYYVPAEHVVAVADLPFTGGEIGRMTYGPLWAIISGFIALVSKGRLIVSIILFKMLLLSFWSLSVWLVHYLASEKDKTLSVMLFGLCPLSLMHGVGDGHNDIVMVSFILLWIVFCKKNKPIPAAVMLALAVLIKYVAAALFILHLTQAFIHRRRNGREWFFSCLACVFVVIAGISVFFRSFGMFSEMLEMQDWLFWTPASTLQQFRIPVSLTDSIVIAIGFLGACWYTRIKKDESFVLSALCILTAVMLGVVKHVWPWFVVWVLPLAAIYPGKKVSFFVFGLAFAAPFVLIPWAASVESCMNRFWCMWVPGLLMYVTAISAVIFGNRVIPQAKSILPDS